MSTPTHTPLRHRPKVTPFWEGVAVDGFNRIIDRNELIDLSVARARAAALLAAVEWIEARRRAAAAALWDVVTRLNWTDLRHEVLRAIDGDDGYTYDAEKVVIGHRGRDLDRVENRTLWTLLRERMIHARPGGGLELSDDGHVLLAEWDAAHSTEERQ